ISHQPNPIGVVRFGDGTLPAAPAGFEYIAVDSGNHGFLNTVRPTFWDASIHDQWQVSSKFKADLALRTDHYQYKGADTGGPVRDFWFNAWNADECISTAPGSLPISKTRLGVVDVSQPCPAGFVSATQINVSAPLITFTKIEPHAGFSYA